MNYYCLTPIDMNLQTIDRMMYVLTYKNWYNNNCCSPLETIIIILLAILNYRFNIVFHNDKYNPNHVIELRYTLYTTILYNKRVNLNDLEDIEGTKAQDKATHIRLSIGILHLLVC